MLMPLLLVTVPALITAVVGLIGIIIEQRTVIKKTVLELPAIKEVADATNAVVHKTNAVANETKRENLEGFEEVKTLLSAIIEDMELVISLIK